jgi:hypothetical protein
MFSHENHYVGPMELPKNHWHIMIFMTKSRGIAGNHQARETKFHQRINMEARQGHNSSPRDGMVKKPQKNQLG